MGLREAITQQIMKVVLENKDQYIEMGRDALVNFVKQVKVEGHDESVIEHIIQNFSSIAALILDTYHLLKAIIDKYGHPEVKKT